MCAAQLEGIGDRAVVICFLGDAFGNSVRDRVLTGGVQRDPHQILVKMNQDGLVSALFGIDGVQRDRFAADTHGQRDAGRLFLATSGKQRDHPYCRQEKGRQLFFPLHSNTPSDWSKKEMPHVQHPYLLRTKIL